MSVTPANVQIPSDPDAPVIADFIEHALQVAYVNRKDLSSLRKDQWDKPGVYVLLTDDASGQAYVGKSGALRTRLQNHDTDPPHDKDKPPIKWNRAMAVKRDTTAGFNTAEIGYLEGRVSAEIGAVQGIKVVQGQTSGDRTLPNHMQIALDAFVPSILAALRLTGVDITRTEADVDTDSVDEAMPTTGRAKKNILLSDVVGAGLLQAGETLYLKQADVEAQGRVTANGGIIVNDVEHSSPSSAARSALGLQSSNGWLTWRLQSAHGPFLDSLRVELEALEDERAAVKTEGKGGSANNIQPNIESDPSSPLTS